MAQQRWFIYPFDINYTVYGTIRPIRAQEREWVAQRRPTAGVPVPWQLGNWKDRIGKYVHNYLPRLRFFDWCASQMHQWGDRIGKYVHNSLPNLRSFHWCASKKHQRKDRVGKHVHSYFPYLRRLHCVLTRSTNGVPFSAIPTLELVHGTTCFLPYFFPVRVYANTRRLEYNRRSYWLREMYPFFLISRRSDWLVNIFFGRPGSCLHQSQSKWRRTCTRISGRPSFASTCQSMSTLHFTGY